MARIWNQEEQHMFEQAAVLAGCAFDLESPPSPRALPKTPPTPLPCAGEDPLPEELVKEYKRTAKNQLVKAHKLHGAQFDITSPSPSPVKRQKASHLGDEVSTQELSQLVANGIAAEARKSSSST